jgi:hypothetical protein
MCIKSKRLLFETNPTWGCKEGQFGPDKAFKQAPKNKSSFLSQTRRCEESPEIIVFPGSEPFD